MRYNVHSPCAFHNRIAKSLGVLVGAALVAVLGLPSAAQAQTPAAPDVTGTGDGMVGSDGTLTAMWGQPLGTDSDQDQWLLEYTEPDVAWDDATKVMLDETVGMSEALSANDPRIHHGVWRFRVSYYQEDSDDVMEGMQGKVIGTASALTDYHHGPPTAAPTGLTAHPAGQTPAGSSGMQCQASRMNSGIPQTRQIPWSGQPGRRHAWRYGRHVGNGYGVHVRTPRSRRDPCRSW